MTGAAAIAAADPDAAVDQEIAGYIDPLKPRSFFLYAGAGSGKTRSLVNTLAHIRDEHGAWLWLRSKRVAVITYTNAAADEIKRRAKSDPLFEVSTIHSFLWSLLAGFNRDIREWLRSNLQEEILEIERAQQKGRATSKAAEQRARSLIAKQERLAGLDEVRVFTYNPNGDNRSREALNHAEVIAMGAAFITDKPALRRLLVGRFPILLIDESQDTSKLLVGALLHLEAEFKGLFCLGLFGDMMQRIYADGDAGLPNLIPDHWAKPAKVMNHRSPARIVALINKVRSADDDHVQQHRPDKPGGVVRLFVAETGHPDRTALEQQAKARMAEVTGDQAWTQADAVKTLGLEHMMLARRMGFADLFAPLHAVDRLKTGLLDGSLPGLRLFWADVLPVVHARKAGQNFALAAMLRKRSPLLQPATLKKGGPDQPRNIAGARGAVDQLVALWDEDGDPSCRDVLKVVAETGLFQVPDSLRPHVDVPKHVIVGAAPRDEAETAEPEESEAEQEEDDSIVSATLDAWDQALKTPISQVALYAAYVEGTSAFDTHQGVKGLEFPRVMVIHDDDEARGFMFSYDKLLGAKPLSDRDLEREEAGEDSALRRTRRLFYVTASRAEGSLAMLVYSAQPAKVVASVVEAGWFAADEVERIERVAEPNEENAGAGEGPSQSEAEQGPQDGT